MAEAPPTYTREEMDAILKRAIERQQAKAEEIPHEDLVAAAGEVGIPREEVEAAARDLEAERQKRDGGAPQEAPRAATSPLAPTNEDRTRPLHMLRVIFGIIACAVVVQHRADLGVWMWPILAVAALVTVQRSRLIVGVGSLNDARTAPRVSRRERRRMRREERVAEFERKVAIGADAIVRIIDEAKGMKARLEQAERDHRAAHAKPTEAKRVLVTPPPPMRVDARQVQPDEIERDDAPGERQRRRRV